MESPLRRSQVKDCIVESCSSAVHRFSLQRLEFLVAPAGYVLKSDELEICRFMAGNEAYLLVQIEGIALEVGDHGQCAIAGTWHSDQMFEPGTKPPGGASTSAEVPLLLTARELQVAALVAMGFSNKQVSSRLGISEWTVCSHLRRIFIKLGVDTRAAMVFRCSSLLQAEHIRNTPNGGGQGNGAANRDGVHKGMEPGTTR